MKLQNLAQVKGVFAPIVRLKISPKLAYKILKLLKEIEFDENFMNSRIKGLLEEFGQKDDNGKLVIENNAVKMKKGAEEDCKRALNELNDLEVEKPHYSFTLEELQELTLSIQDMAIIQEFIKEDNSNG